MQREEVIVERNPVHGRAATEGLQRKIFARVSRSESRFMKSRLKSSRSPL